jgi:hypothetical protein
MRRDRLIDVTLAQVILLNLIEAFAELDSAVPQSPGWELQLPSGSGAAALVSTAGDLNSKTLPDVPRSLVKALQSEGMRYSVIAHADAVVALDERGEPERAWGALHSDAWWIGRSTRGSLPAMIDSARLLADRHGWDDMRFVVDRAAGGDPA